MLTRTSPHDLETRRIRSNQKAQGQLDHRVQIVVQRDWYGWRTAMVDIDDLTNIHWFQPNGAPRALIHAYVPCTRLHSGDIPHDCNLTPAPHLLLVCVLKSHTAPSVFEGLASQADGWRHPSASHLINS